MYHDRVIHALITDGWLVTHDPLRIHWGGKDLYIDLGAEQVLAAEKAGNKIAVEIKSFLGPSIIADLQQALGQYILYHDLLARIEPDRVLYLAIHVAVFHSLFAEPIGDVLLANQRIRLLVFDPHRRKLCNGCLNALSVNH